MTTKEFHVARKSLIIDPSQYDLNHVIADIEEIRRSNSQRFEMEQLTAIVHVDLETNTCVGYKDLEPDEFWVRGHMPGMPLMPGVLMCEAAAQLASFYSREAKLMGKATLGFGGLKDVHFRGMVRPGERFVVVVRLLKARRVMLVSEFQCFVNENMVCDGVLKGIPLPEKEILEEPS